MSSPIDNYRNYLATNYPDMKLPAGKPYGVIKLAKGYDFGFHVRKDHVSVHFISNGTHDPEEVMGYINDKGIGDKTYGDGLEPDVFRGTRNAAVVRCEVHIPLESVDELRKPTLRKHSQQIFGELYDDFSGIAGVERPKQKEDTAETVEEVAETQGPVNIKEMLVEKDGVYYTKDTNEPYSGEVFLSSNGKIFYEGTLKDGKWEGKTTFYKYGNKSQEGNYIDGEKQSVVYWSPNGEESSELIYRDGNEWQGILTLWHENGQKWCQDNWFEGMRIAEQEWDEDGNLIEKD
jgi:hypothetical protein